MERCEDTQTRHRGGYEAHRDRRTEGNQRKTCVSYVRGLSYPGYYCFTIDRIFLLSENLFPDLPATFALPLMMLTYWFTCIDQLKDEMK